jgi:hypothetical protein
MFEDITGNKKEKQDIVYTNAIMIANDKEYNIKVYNVDMTAGIVTGFIKDNTRKIDGYTDYEISIPIDGTNCEWSFPVSMSRTGPNTLKFYSPGAN